MTAGIHILLTCVKTKAAITYAAVIAIIAQNHIPQKTAHTKSGAAVTLEKGY